MLTRGHVPKGVDDVRKWYQTLRAVRQDRAHTPRALKLPNEQPPARKGLACEATWLPAWLRPTLRKNDSSDDDDQAILPEERYAPECALVGDHLHLFGGSHGYKYFPRNEFFVTNVRRAEKKWIRRLTRGRTIPPPCEGARCVVIDKMIYSYGGRTKEGHSLGIVYRLDPKKIEWIEVATPIGGKKPHERSYCCLCAIGSRMIMFGGLSEKKIPRNQLQSQATQNECDWSNDIYEFRLEEGNEKGMWFDLELSGTRPKPLVAAAMATIDEHRALLHGRDVENESHSFLINFNLKFWTLINFNVKPSPRRDHTICHLVTEGLEDESICLLVGGRMIDKTNSDYVYVLDRGNFIAYQMDVDPEFGEVVCHTCHCVPSDNKTTDVIVCGGVNWDFSYRPILSCFCLDVKNESYMKIKREILSSRRATVCATSSPRLLLPSDREDIAVMLRLMEHSRQRCSELTEEKSSIRNELASAQRQITQIRLRN
ncbi:kelch domain-containing protein 2-like isoform X2 [Oscarella lobularis]|uniref:kelch domain-containing protein 2-like isoform X2 n=1 Tax=Oscarella lobularis TaxID=121494 RepID=UPI003313F609